MLSTDGVLVENFFNWAISVNFNCILSLECVNERTGACRRRLERSHPVLVSICTIRNTSWDNRTFSRFTRLSTLLLVLEDLSWPIAYIRPMLYCGYFLLLLQFNSLVTFWANIFDESPLILKELFKSASLLRFFFFASVNIGSELAPFKFLHFLCLSHCS